MSGGLRGPGRSWRQGPFLSSLSGRKTGSSVVPGKRRSLGCRRDPKPAGVGGEESEGGVRTPRRFWVPVERLVPRTREESACPRGLD